MTIGFLDACALSVFLCISCDYLGKKMQIYSVQSP